MALSKYSSEKLDKIAIEYERYDYDSNWDSCDYLDPTKLPEILSETDLSIIQWNTRGLRGNLNDIDHFLNNILEQKIGIVIINESWVNSNSPPLPKIKGYNYIGKSRENRKGGEVGFLVRNDLTFR